MHTSQPVSSVDLVTAVSAALEAGRAEWPGFPLSFDDFAAHASAVNVTIQNLNRYGADLYLACGCAHRFPGAIQAFERSLFPIVERHLIQQGVARREGEDLSQALRMWLLVERPPRIASYSGRGRLLGWLKVVSTRRALRMALRPAGTGVVVDPQRAAGVASSGLNAELIASRRRHQSDFQQALERSLSALSPKARTILRLSFIEGRNLEGIAGVFGVHRATAARWLTAIQATILSRVRDHLPLNRRPTSSEFRDLAADVRDELFISIERLLREGDHSRSNPA